MYPICIDIFFLFFLIFPIRAETSRRRILDVSVSDMSGIRDTAPEPRIGVS
uniref:Uncharacterized protein n=1 Tax=Arundo donax TaxID=35708 RepID=A0A0A8Z5D6_ARUDO